MSQSRIPKASTGPFIVYTAPSRSTPRRRVRASLLRHRVDVDVVAEAVAATESRVDSDGIQCRLEIGLEIPVILDANRQPDQAVLDSQFLSDSGINRGVGHDGGMVDE